jgi:hypothetical protein
MAAVAHERVIPEMEMIPLTYGGHTVAYHFVRQVGA